MKDAELELKYAKIGAGDINAPDDTAIESAEIAMDYANKRVVEELKKLKEQETYSTDFALDLRIKELKQQI